MYNEIIKLISVEKVTDEYGDIKEKKTEREVYAELKSIKQSEFYQAAGVGMKPEMKFVLPDYLDYQGERIISYQTYGTNTWENFGVIRTYRNGNELEIVCGKGIEDERA